MRLPFSFLFGKKEQKNYFLALLLQNENIKAVLFEEVTGKICIVSHAETKLPTLLENMTPNQWLEAIDHSVSLAESAISHTLQTEQTIFGVKESWTTQGKIQKEYLTKLKGVCDELALKPIGFLVFSEAIVHLLQQEEGAPVSAILVETGSTHVTISLIRAGRVIESHQVPLEQSLPHSVDAGLKEFSNAEILPSRIILFNSANNEKTSQAFIGHAWSKSLPFLHVPQVTILPVDFDIRGILFGTALQMGFDILSEHIPIPQTSIEESTIAHITPSEESFFESSDTQLAKKIEEEVEHPQEIHTTILPDTAGSDYFGFVKNRDVAHTTPTSQPLAEDPPPPIHFSDEIVKIPEEIKEKETEELHSDSFPTQSSKLFQESFSAIKEGITSLMPHQSTEPAKKQLVHTSQPLLANKVWIYSISMLVGIALLICGYIFFLQATVTITLQPTNVENDQQVTFVKGTSDISKSIIGTTEVATDESGNVSANTTGSKDIGTSAKGQVTVFSRLTDTTTLPKGTTITASNGLTFTLDSTTTIASFSGGPDDPSVTQANVIVTASSFGTEYNLPSGTKFTISGQSKSDMSAKNDTAFSGGTKNTVTVVSQKDIDSLITTLTKNLESTAASDMQKKLDANQVLLTNAMNEQVTIKTPSKAVGDTASSVSMQATIHYSAFGYNKNDLAIFSQDMLKNKLPPQAILSSADIITVVKDVTKKDDASLLATLHSSAALLPPLDTKKLTASMRGKSFEEVTTIVKAIPQVTNMTIVLSPPFPFLPHRFPTLTQHIHIVVKK